MFKLVEVCKDEIFTTSKIIADGTNNKHYAVRQIIQKCEKLFEEMPELGKVIFKMEPLESSQSYGTIQGVQARKIGWKKRM